VAKLHHVEWETRAECLDAVASAYGERPPAGDVPGWWHEFEKWYQEQKKAAKDGVVSATLRTEAHFYDDEGDDDEDDAVEEDEPDDEGDGEE
jgi:hypothetical protein